MQLNDIADSHRPLLEPLVPDGLTYEIEIVHHEGDDGTYSYDCWALGDVWLYHSQVEITEPVPPQPQTMRRAATWRTVTRLTAVQQVSVDPDGVWTAKAPPLGETEIPESIAKAITGL